MRPWHGLSHVTAHGVAREEGAHLPYEAEGGVHRGREWRFLTWQVERTTWCWSDMRSEAISLYCPGGQRTATSTSSASLQV